ncbi:o-succinylbenzoate synthase [Vibrio stylophorae]|uniref:o-succinylbenzoate synthase n=1 Tax=Vibrio stylophorae TaxID=659351 RepID=A0ABM8ZU61_9VIBR|nr:o-succinylbenzoate synthase [Vibrio stylophorae]CAH0533840.1 o-succinylbenzoate synthase [Vibrio stylophorae]
MRQAMLQRYSLEMDSGVILRQQRLSQRDGLIVTLTVNGFTGQGEIAPLPSFSEETLAQAQAQAIEVLSHWQETGQWPDDWDALYPSVAFGLSMAQMELDGALQPEGNYACAPLCSGDPDVLIARLGQTGQRVAKMKVGLYEAIRDGMIANLMLEAVPELQLRMDANRAWLPAKAAQFAKYIAPELRARIDFIEEPCRTPEQSLAFAEIHGIAIAWDESVREPNFTVQANPWVRAIIIKPTLIGSVSRVISLIQQAHTAGMQAVLSASLESSLGLTQLARLAAQFTPMTVPGLDTLQLFRQQLGRAWPESSLPLQDLSLQEVIWQR